MALRALADRKDVRFEDGTFDVRRQELRNRNDNDKLGVVDDVLIDENGRSRYLSVNVEGQNRRVLLPVGETEADRGSDVVWVSGLNRQGLQTLPEYDRNPASVTEDYERRLHTAYDSAHSDDRYYDRSEYRSGAWGRGSGTAETGRLERIDKLDNIDVASGDPDPRGWSVVGRDGREVGKIDHLIGDTGAMKVRYLVMDVDRSILKEGRKVLIPVGQVDLDTRKNRVVVDALSATMISTLPVYTGGAPTRDEEKRIVALYGSSYTGEQRYRHPRYRDENLYGRTAQNTDRTDEQRITRSEEELNVGRRERKAGEVDVRKHVETEHVRTPVTTHREEVEVERRPATGRSTAPRMGDQEIVVPVTKEEVVVDKRPQVKEEIVVRKRDVAERQMVEEDVRKEVVDVDEHRDRR